MKTLQRIWIFFCLWGTYHYENRIDAELAWELARFLSVHEWLRQYIQRDTVRFSLSAIWKLYREQHVTQTVGRFVAQRSKKEMAQLNATVKIDIELFHPKKYKDGWYYAVVQGKNKFVGLAKKEPFTCENPDPIKESGELWFEFGDTPSEAFRAIVRAQRRTVRKIKSRLSSNGAGGQ
jgi:hypothetical protein